MMGAAHADAMMPWEVGGRSGQEEGSRRGPTEALTWRSLKKGITLPMTNVPTRTTDVMRKCR